MSGSTRDRILDAAAHVMHSQGFARTTTKEISRAAGLSEGTLYKHFADKSELFLAVLHERVPSFGPFARALHAPEGPLRDRLLAIARAAIQFYIEGFPMSASVFCEPGLLAAHRAAMARLDAGPQRPVTDLTAFFGAEQHRGNLRPEADCAAAAALLLGACFQYAFLCDFAQNPPESAAVLAYAESVTDTLLAGLRLERFVVTAGPVFRHRTPRAPASWLWVGTCLYAGRSGEMGNKTRYRAAQTVVMVPLICMAAACGGSGVGYGGGGGHGSATGGAASTHPAASVAGGLPIAVGHSSFGSIVTGAGGRAVYLFEKDGSTSSCYGQCAAAWPPVLTTGAPVAAAGVNPALLGTVRRTNGTRQVTYAGHPLYYFAGDSKAGDVTGEGSQSFGAPWDLLTPAGAKITNSVA